jgi:hypothetical protein
VILRLKEFVVDHMVEVETDLPLRAVSERRECTLVAKVSEVAPARLWFCHALVRQLRGKDEVGE